MSNDDGNVGVDPTGVATDALSARLIDLETMRVELLFQKRKLEFEVEAARQRLGQIEVGFTETEKRHAEMQALLAERSEALATATADNATLRAELSALLADAEPLRTRLEEATRRLEVGAVKYQGLVARGARHKKEIAALEAEVQKARRSADERVGRFKARVELLQERIESRAEDVRRTLAYRLGTALIQGLSSWRGVIGLPGALLAIRAEARRRRLVRGQKETAIAQASQAILPKTPISADRAAPAIVAGVPRVEPSRLRAGPGRLRIAGVMDEFTAHSYGPECDLLQMTPGEWLAELAAFEPDLLFIESAWKGIDGLWQLKISNASPEILDAVAWCRAKRIPVAFWNKEDPVHFDTFLPIAAQADYVFTTDIDCIPKYKYRLGHDRVYLLPFAAQPRQHNPVEIHPRKTAFNFAGSYYLRYPERQRDFDRLISAVESYAPVEIYDRNYNNPHPHYTFPARFAGYILGNLPFSEIDRAYKGYRYGINMNTIKQSQTMFARRVFELLASNTVVVSNYSHGMRLLFGDLVISSDEIGELQRRLSPLIADETHYRKHRLMGLRKVMSEHTYAARLDYVRAKLAGTTFERRTAAVTVFAVAPSLGALDHLVASFRRQAHPARRLIVLTSFDASSVGPIDGVDVVSDAAQAVAELRAALAPTSFVALFSAADHYGPHYLTDLTLAAEYSSASAFGKVAHHVARDGGCRLEDDGGQYRPAATLPARAAVARAEQVSEDWLRSALAAPDEAAFHFADQLALDEFHYCRDGADLDPAVLEAALYDLLLADTGARLEGHLYGVAEGLRAPDLPPGAVGVAAGSDLPEIGGEELFSLLAKPGGGKVRILETSAGFRIVSALPADKHMYVYATQSLSRERCNLVLDSRYRVDCQRKLDLRTVFEFQDADGVKLGHAISTAEKTVSLPIPPACKQVRIGFRIQGPGDADVRRIVFGGLNERPALFVGRSDHLVVARQYPAYDDLYRYGFLHSRVRGYRRLGALVDVFRLREAGEERYFSEFEGIEVSSGDTMLLDATLASGQHQRVSVHLLDRNMWEVLSKHVGRVGMTVWIHGSEIQPLHRRAFNLEGLDPAEIERRKKLSDTRLAFWRDLLSDMPENLHLVFVSRYLAETVMDDLGFRLPEGCYSIIHNPIDTDLFAYIPKEPGQRNRVLSIRPYTSRVYGNDLAVAAILALRDRPCFGELEFRLVGEGPLFDETTAQLQGLDNVVLEKRFLTQTEIAKLHQAYGTYLTPCRSDTQGVSRDEAMSSGLVPIVSRVAAIPEFVDETCGMLTEAEDVAGLAAAIIELHERPERFLELSKAASERIRRQTGAERILRQELELIGAVPRTTG